MTRSINTLPLRMKEGSYLARTSEVIWWRSGRSWASFWQAQWKVDSFPEGRQRDEAIETDVDLLSWVDEQIKQAAGKVRKLPRVQKEPMIFAEKPPGETMKEAEADWWSPLSTW